MRNGKNHRKKGHWYNLIENWNVCLISAWTGFTCIIEPEMLTPSDTLLCTLSIERSCNSEVMEVRELLID